MALANTARVSRAFFEQLWAIVECCRTAEQLSGVSVTAPHSCAFWASDRLHVLFTVLVKYG